MTKKTFSIPVLISNPDVVAFKEQVDEACKDKIILKKRIGISIVPFHNQRIGQMGLMNVPYCYLEYECTEAEYNSWKFQTNLNNQ